MPSHQPEESDLALIAEAIRRRIWVVAVCFVFAVLAAVGLTTRAEKEYSATASLLLRASVEVDPQRAVDTNLQLLGLPAIGAGAARRIAGNPEAAAAARDAEAQQEGESDIIEIVTTAADSDAAAQAANAYAEEAVAFREGDGSSGGLQTGRLELVERALPSSSPVSPKPARNLIFGGLIGLVLGFGLALLLEQLDRRMKREDDLADATELSQLAAIPKLKAFNRDHLGIDPLTPGEAEVFRMLRANLRFYNVERNLKSVLVTSAEPGEGKTLVSLGLALAAVTSGEHVLLLEADMRDPGLTGILGLPESGGLSRALSTEGDEPLAGAVTTVKAGHLAQSTGNAPLDVVAAGAIPPNPTELIESQRMKHLIREAEGTYDFVVIDTPPVLVVSDAMPLVSEVSGVVAVSGLGVSTRHTAAALAQQLERLGAPTLGMVANFAEHSSRAYQGYGYGRAPGYGSREAPPA